MPPWAGMDESFASSSMAMQSRGHATPTNAQIRPRCAVARATQSGFEMDRMPASKNTCSLRDILETIVGRNIPSQVWIWRNAPFHDGLQSLPGRSDYWVCRYPFAEDVLEHRPVDSLDGRQRRRCEEQMHVALGAPHLELPHAHKLHHGRGLLPGGFGRHSIAVFTL